MSDPTSVSLASQRIVRPRPMPTGVQLPTHITANMPARPPLHASPRPPAQQLNFASPIPNVTMPPHSRENSLFSPRPNDVYTPLGKLDGTPRNTQQNGLTFAHAMQHQQALNQSQQYYVDSGLASPVPYVPATTHHRRPLVQELDGGHAQQFSQGQHFPAGGHNLHQQPYSNHNNHSTYAPVHPAQQNHLHQQHHLGDHSNGSTSSVQRSPPRTGRSQGTADAFSLDAQHHDHDDSTGKDRVHGSSVIAGFDGSERAAAFNLCNFILGSGIVALPAALGQAGVVVGVVLLLLQACITDYSLKLLISSGLSLKVFDYEELLRAAFGRRGWQLGLASIFLLDFGVMVTFLIILTDTFTPVLAFYLSSPGSESIFASRTFTLWFVAFIAVLPLSLFRSLKQLGFVSMVSVGSVCGIVVMLVWKVVFGGVESAASGSSTSSISPLSDSPFTILGSNPFSAFGTISFVFVCHDGSFAIFQSLSQPSLGRWSKVVRASIIVAATPALIMAVFGHFSFYASKQGVQSNVLNNFPASDHLVNLARVALGASMVMTYPLNLFMCRHVLAKISHAPSVHHLPEATHLAFTVGLFLASLIIASCLTDLGFVQALVGAFAGSLLAFVLPAATALRTGQMVEGRQWICMENAPKLALLGFGAFVMVVSTIQTISG